MEPFVAADEFVSEAEARHKSTFFEPEYGTERSQEEYAFDHSKSNDQFGKTGVGGITPCKGPSSFAVEAWDCLGEAEDVQLRCRVLDVCVNEK